MLLKNSANIRTLINKALRLTDKRTSLKRCERFVRLTVALKMMAQYEIVDTCVFLFVA